MKDSSLKAVADAALFSGIKQKDLAAMMKCLNAHERRYAKGETIRSVGDGVEEIGFIVSGSVLLTKLDFEGNVSLIAKPTAGSVFGEALSCLEQAVSDVDITAAENTEILFLNTARITRTCSSACVFHQRMLRNLLVVIASKNVQLNQKVEHMSKRTTREKLLSYLAGEAGDCGDTWFTVPLNRQQLADYLCVERSAMSWELCRLRNEGVIEFQRNRFRFRLPLKADIG